jgi:hypothetical protein
MSWHFAQRLPTKAGVTQTDDRDSIPSRELGLKASHPTDSAFLGLVKAVGTCHLLKMTKSSLSFLLDVFFWKLHKFLTLRPKSATDNDVTELYSQNIWSWLFKQRMEIRFTTEHKPNKDVPTCLTSTRC